MVPAHWTQLSWIYGSYPVNRAFWGLGACSVHRGSQKSWRIAGAGSSPPLKPVRLCGLLSQLPCQLRWDLSEVCSAQCLRDPSGSGSQWPSTEPCTEKHAAWTFFPGQIHFPTPLKRLPGVSSQINHLHPNFSSWVCALVGGGEGRGSTQRNAHNVCHFIVCKSEWLQRRPCRG